MLKHQVIFQLIYLYIILLECVNAVFHLDYFQSD